MSESEKLRNYVFKQIVILNSQKETSGGRSKLAELRRGIGKYPGEIPELWGVFLNDLPEEMLSNDGTPSYAEWAVYVSLTLFALHQQGNAESVHAESVSLGRAAAELMNEKTDAERERVLRRFGPVITAADMQELSYHLRSLVQLFKSKGIKLDYVRLAEDIYGYQFENSRKKVQLRWGQDFYYNKGED